MLSDIVLSNIILQLPVVSDYPATLVTTPNAQLKPHGNEEGQKYWHLFKHVDVDDPKVSPLLSKKLVTEVFFPRILYTKVTVFILTNIILLIICLVTESSPEFCR